MKTEDVIKFFGSKKLASEILGIKGGRSTINVWGEKPPIMRQYQIEILTRGYLRAEDFLTRREFYPAPDAPAHVPRIRRRKTHATQDPHPAHQPD